MLVDLFDRGALDVVVANQRGPLLVYANDVAPGRHWVGFDLQGGCGGDADASGNGDGPAGCSNRSAIGAQVEVFWSGRRQVQEVSGGSGFCSQNQRRLHFGLGASPAIEKVVIRWPSGRTQELTAIDAGRVHRIVEPI